MAQHNERGSEFEEQVSAILQLRGYAVEHDQTVDGTQIDLVAQSQDPLNDLEYMVECCSSAAPVGIGLVKEKAAVLVNANRRRRLLFVSLSGFTREAKDFAKAKEVIQLTTLDELERTLLDLRPYTNWLIRQFEKSEGIFSEGRLFETYIALRCLDSRNRERPLKDAVDDWLKDEATGLLFLLGEYGRGKTSFCRHLAYTLCRALRMRETQGLMPVPLLINLRDYRRSQSMEQIVTDTLLNRYGVRIASFSHFQRFCSTGRVMLLLDGFDEMADSAQTSHVKDCFRQIYALSGMGAKTIVTCRTNYFTSHQDVVDLLNSFSIKLSEVLGEQGLEGDFSFEGMARMLEICPLSDSEVFAYLERRFGDQANEVLTQLKSIHDLTDLSRRPVLLDMICDTLPQLLASGRAVNSATLYEFYTKRWTRRDGWRTSLPDSVRQDFCEALAWVTHLAQMETLDYPLIRDAVVLGFSGACESQEQLEIFLNDIQTCSFLVRSETARTFRFAHKSFREFFVARRLIRELIGGQVPSRNEVDEFLSRRKLKDDEQSAKAKAAKERETRRKAKKELARESAGLYSWQSSPDTSNWTRMIRGFSGGFDLAPLFQQLDKRFSHIDELDTFIRYDDPTPTFRQTDKYALDESFYDSLDTILRDPVDSNFLKELYISPEIATFALETLVSSKVEINGFLAGLTDELERAAFATLIRIGSACQFMDEYARKLIALIVNTGGWWRESLAPLLGEFGPRMTEEQISTIGAKLEGQAFSRFLFALIRSKHDYQSAFISCFRPAELTPLQRILISYGSKKAKSDKPANFLTEDLVVDLIRGHAQDELPFLESVLRHGSYSPNRILRTIIDEIRLSGQSDSRGAYKSLLRLIAHPTLLKPVRLAIASEKDAKIRRDLKDLEKNILDRQSRNKDWLEPERLG